MPSLLTWDTNTEYETAGAGAPVVLIHGATLDKRVWSPQWRVLGRSARVVRYDLRGHGRSSYPKAGYTAENYVMQLRTLLDGLRISRAVLVGHSQGAAIAMHFARRFPARVAALVLVSPEIWGAPVPEGSAYAPRKEARFDPGFVDDPRTVKTALRSWLQFGIFDGTRKNDLAWRTLETIALSHNGAPWGIDARATDMPDDFTFLEEVGAPVLVLAGDGEDPYFQQTARAAADRIPGARFSKIEGSGHVPMIEKPAEVNRAVLDFLASLGLAASLPPGAEEPPKPRKRRKREGEEVEPPETWLEEDEFDYAPEPPPPPPPVEATVREDRPPRREDRGERGDRGRGDDRRRDRGPSRDRRDQGESRGGPGGGRGDRSRSEGESRGGRDDRSRNEGGRPKRDHEGPGGRGGDEGGGPRPERKERGDGEARDRGRDRGRGRGRDSRKDGEPREERRQGNGGRGERGRPGPDADRSEKSDRPPRRQRRSRSREDRPVDTRPTPPPMKPEKKPEKKGWRNWFGFGKKKKDDE